ncbi:GAF domain-containing protein [bacterium]|nr:GAF domain-containing protein [bacterium]
MNLIAKIRKRRQENERFIYKDLIVTKPKGAGKSKKKKNLDGALEIPAGDEKLGNLLKTIVNEVKDYAEDQIRHIRKLSEIGKALTIEKDINKLFEMIVNEAREITGADAGTLYTMDENNRSLHFEVLQNETLNIHQGGASGNPIVLPNVQLYLDGNEPNHTNVSSHVALAGETVNIPDVYKAKNFNFSGTKKYDAATGYRTCSMLVIPMHNHENKIIGVLQLLNAIDRQTGKTIAFSSEYVNIIESLASQAAVALTNVQLINDLKNLFYAFIKSIATAIDEKSPYTGGHIRRVVDLSMLIAKKINESDAEPFRDIHFSEDEMEELRIAAWMHDVGKVITPGHVVDKATKLETVVDRIALVETRFRLIEASVVNRFLQDKIELMTSRKGDSRRLKKLDAEMDKEIREIRESFEFIKSCNNTGEFMRDESVARIQAIAARTYTTADGQFPYLSEKEAEDLCIRKGTLSTEERKIIENHAGMTKKITEQLTFPRHLARVPEFASAHHEKLDGSGYPKGLSGDELPLQSRIMAVADIFEALTAKDRPYKEPMSLSQAVRILSFMKKDNHIDPGIFDLFVDGKLHLAYAEKEMNPDQIDMT